MTTREAYKGFPIAIRVDGTTWGTWVSEAEIELGPNERVVVAVLSGADDTLMKQYTSEEEALKEALQTAHQRIDRSEQKKG